jgi:lambda family phage minor tail protein L
MIVDINKQRVTSDFVELYQVELPGGGYTYFTTYPTTITFRDYYSPYTSQTYIPLPITFTGYESKADGAYSRPRVSFANILTTFKDLLGSNDDLIGKKVVRRKTLYSQLSTGSGSSPPVELPKQIFIIDRIESESPVEVIFELAAPFDLAGINVPGRYIIPNTCAWIYQGSAADRNLPKAGGCTWRENNSNPGFAVYYDVNNFLITSSSFADHTGGSYTKNTLYRVTKSLTRINTDGTFTTVSGFDYWQAITSGLGALSTSNSRRCRRFITGYTVNNNTDYFAYKNGRIYGDVVLHNNKMWVCIISHRNQTPFEGSSYWERVDICAKKLSSCAVRFKAKQNSGVTLVDQDETVILPYGGFPAARRFNR